MVTATPHLLHWGPTVGRILKEIQGEGMALNQQENEPTSVPDVWKRVATAKGEDIGTAFLYLRHAVFDSKAFKVLIQILRS